MKKPSNARVNVLILVVVLLVLVMGVVAVIGYGKVREQMAANAQEKQQEAELTPEPTETPTPEPTPDPSDPEVQKSELVESIETAVESNDVQSLGEAIRYTAEDGSIAAYEQEDVAAVMLHLKKSEDDYTAFIETIKADEVTVGEDGDVKYLLLSNENLRKMTNTEEPAQSVVAEEVTPTPAGNGKMIAIDAGHQGQGNSEQEPIGPGASQTKAKVASGTSGRTTGVPEYQLNLDVSLKLKEELINRGYQVYMIRETNEVNISNAERAQLAAESGADILVRIHANGSDNTSVAGALTMAPSVNNSFVGADLAAQCQKLSQDVITAYCASTGANNQGVYQTDDMSGLNWCTIPATIVEMGYMTNPDEDTKMQTAEYQNLIVQGIANGIDQYFAS